MKSLKLSNRTILLIVFAITISMSAIELIIAIISNSIALLSDTLHSIVDSIGIGIALWASVIALKQTDNLKSFGYWRAEVIAALFNSILLLILASYIIVKAIMRLRFPEEISGHLMLIGAIASLVANGSSILILSQRSGKNINLKGALFHVAGDALGSLGAIIAAILVTITGLKAIDAIVGIVICAIITVGGVKLLLESIHILMEGTPVGFNKEEVKKLLCGVHGVISVHDIHAWSITAGKSSATAHLIISDEASPQEVRKKAAKIFEDKWGITHLTLQILKESEQGCSECEDCHFEEKK